MRSVQPHKPGSPRLSIPNADIDFFKWRLTTSVITTRLWLKLRPALLYLCGSFATTRVTTMRQRYFKTKMTNVYVRPKIQTTTITAARMKVEVAGMSGLMVNMSGIVNATTSPGRGTAKTPAMNSMRVSCVL